MASTAEISGLRKPDEWQHLAANLPVAFQGDGLNVDYASHLSQQDVVYHAPPREFYESMPLGDGDLGASVWCPGHFQLQVCKSDLWADPPRIGEKKLSGPPANWQRLSAGTLSIHTAPEILADPQAFEQRLNLYSGIITIKADSAQGSCQISAFTSATAGVMVLNYQDQTVRSTPRSLELTHQREGHLFALGETIGVLHPLRDRRCAMAARVVGHPGQPTLKTKTLAALVLEPRRSSDFTVVIAVATSAVDQDPVRIAKSRVDNAILLGYDKLLSDHRRHWMEFWKKSFLKISCDQEDPLPGYLENMWHLGLFQIAACSRGFDAPLPAGGLWEEESARKPPPALYVGANLRAMMTPLLPANHLELTVPFLESYHRMMAPLIARTKNDLGCEGVRIPSVFNRHGDDFEDIDVGNGSSQTLPIADIGDGIEAALLFWDAWRYASDPFLLNERVYPMLRSVLDYTLSFAKMYTESFTNSVSVLQLSNLIHAAKYASEELELDQAENEVWLKALYDWSLELAIIDSKQSNTLISLTKENFRQGMMDWIKTEKQTPQGFFYGGGKRPNLARTGDICAAVGAMLIREEVILPADDPLIPTASASSILAHRALKFLPVFPEGWNAAFTLLAPGGFYVTCEAYRGEIRYISVKSMNGRTFRFFNPWGEGCRLGVSEGKIVIAESASKIVQFETSKDGIYVVEKENHPISLSLRSRIKGVRNEKPRVLMKDSRIGLMKAVKQD